MLITSHDRRVLCIHSAASAGRPHNPSFPDREAWRVLSTACHVDIATRGQGVRASVARCIARPLNGLQALGAESLARPPGGRFDPSTVNWP